MNTLLASAGSLAAIMESVTQFYCGTEMTPQPTSKTEWRLVRRSDGKLLDGVRIVLTKRRFRFEMAA